MPTWQRVAVVALTSGYAALVGYRLGGGAMAGVLAGLFGFVAAAAVAPEDFPDDPDPFG